MNPKLFINIITFYERYDTTEHGKLSWTNTLLLSTVTKIHPLEKFGAWKIKPHPNFKKNMEALNFCWLYPYKICNFL